MSEIVYCVARLSEVVYRALACPKWDTENGASLLPAANSKAAVLRINTFICIKSVNACLVRSVSGWV